MTITAASRTRHGFTLVELLVVITVIAILASMVVPAIGFVKELANKSKCGKNQSGIFSGILAYSESADGKWPSPAGTGGQAKLAYSGTGYSGETGAKYTAGAFELLAIANRDTITSNLFKCPSTTTTGPDPDKRPSPQSLDTSWGWSTKGRVAYSFDWSAPADSGSARPVLSDRSPKNHKKNAAMICYADGHYSSSKVLVGDPNAVLGPNKSMEDDTSTVDFFVENISGMGTDQSESTGTATVSPNEKDNIYDDTGDYGGTTKQADVIVPGKGNARRAFMK